MTPSALEKLTELMAQPPGLSGSGLGARLRQAGYTADQAADALLEKGFTVQREDLAWGIVLHVSRKPLNAGIEVALALMGDTSEVAWHKPQPAAVATPL